LKKELRILNNSGMQENEFEKQLKRAMDDFRIVPPASAWENISRRLDKKRRPKLPFIFLLAAGLFITGYYVFKGYKKQSPQAPGIAEHTKNKYSNTGTASLGKADSLYIGKDHTAGLFSENNNTVNKNSYAKQNRLKESKRVTNYNVGTTLIPGKNNIVAKQYNISEPLQQTGNNNEENNTITTSNYSENNNLNPVKQADTVSQTANDVVTDNIYNGNPLRPDSTAVTSNNTSDISFTSNKKVSVSTKHISKWRLGITAFYGKSNAIEAIAGSDKAASSNAFTPGSLSGADTALYREHPYTASDAYQFGIVIQRNIIKNGFLSAGLIFTHLSTKSDISKEVNSTYIIQNFDRSNSFYALSSYYQPGSKNSFVNKYNFIELPVHFQHDLFPANKFSLSYNAGFSLRQLLSSDALIYNEYNNIYFSQEDQLRKIQIQFLAGANLRYKASKTTSLYLGPQFSYSLSNMLKTGNNGNFHFLVYGLQAELLLQKR
jgi:hypothetical protein